MDMVYSGAPEAARALGVSLPTMHRILDRAGVPSPGRGRRRSVPRSVVETAVKERGVAPGTAGQRSKSELRALAALSRSPLGRESARDVAAVAGVSPTTATRVLERLLHEGLVSHDETKVARGNVKASTPWRARQRAWDAPLSEAVRRVTLPERPGTQPRTGGVPGRFRHLFWNVGTRALTAATDGEYIAKRMLESSDIAAWMWALANVSPEDLERAVSRRGVPARVRALVDNWIQHSAADSMNGDDRE